jgi:hypothetical protein
VPEEVAERDRGFIEALGAVLPSAAASYEQALRDLQAGDRLSWRGPVADLREGLRSVLDHLAPDDQVKRQPWYKQDFPSGPTRAQKARFVAESKGLGETIRESTVSTVAQAEAEIFPGFLGATYGRASRTTHGVGTRQEAENVRALVRVVLGDLLGV